MSEQTMPAAQTPTVAMIRTLGLVAAICGLIIVGAYEGTYDAVTANKKLAIERSVYQVVPEAKSVVEYHALPGGDVVPAGDAKTPDGAIRFFAGYDADGKLVGVAAEAGAKGYADTVRIMFGYRPDCQCINGISVVSMRETPGVGDKIRSDKKFLANFDKLDVRLKDDMSALAHDVVTVKHGTKTDPWQIDAISGATITSRAVGRGIDAAAQALLPKLVPNLNKLASKS
jgi:H+/Na+-translocating ferredoxin:NAD+ oxidoreductase subunit G